MEKFGNYILQEKIHETRNSIIYRGHKENESQNVIIKVLKTQYPTPSEIARFKQEYNLVKNLAINGIIKIYDLVEHGDKYAIIEEDFDGVSLKEILKTKKLELKSFLQISSKISETLGLIHKNNIIHLDIKPDNILVNAKTGMVKITDFGISEVLTHANDEIHNSDVIEGTLPYISPEQTGRMNRSIDYRTDFYSLGITFYEMLTGEVPFKSTDPMELIHSHIARQPVLPDKLNPSIPPVVSGIILKLLSKMPEERYQNGFTITADVNKCLEQLDSRGTIEEFEIGKNDISIKFIIPQIICGREKEIDTLISSFERISRDASELITVSGHPGIGKSALVNEIHKPIVAKRGYFVSGKYEQFRRNVPFNAIIQAFQDLIGRILTEGAERLTIWKKEIQLALGANGKYLTSAIPRLELIIGKQPEIPEQEGDEGLNQFNLIFKNFINVFAQKEHPLVLFLDDLQWADTASLTLIQKLITDSEVKYLLLILAYRDKEVDETHPFARTLGKIQKEGIKTNPIVVTPLDIENINQIIYNFFRCRAEESLPLAEIIYKKTNGNPFFVNQFLKFIYNEGVIKLEPAHGWKWNLEAIIRMQVTDNVVEFMAEKISSLPYEAQEILVICACIGNRFDLETLSVMINKSIDETLSSLGLAIEDGYVSLFGDIYKFHHDRIQEAAYSLLSDEEKARLHYKIGNYLLEHTKESELENKIQYIVNQLNSGKSLLSSQEEIYRLAELNLMAAKKAKRSGAFESSLNYLRKGIELLRENSWKEKYDLTLILYTEAAVAAFRSHDYEGIERFSQIVLSHAKNVLDKERIYEIKILFFTNQNNHQAALEVGLDALGQLGIRFPKNPGKTRIRSEYQRIKDRLSEKNISLLYNLPEMGDKHKIMTMRLLTRLTMTFMDLSTPLHILNSFKRFQLTMKYGYSKETDAAYASLAAVLCGSLGEIDAGYRLCKTVMALSPNERAKNEVSFYFNSMIRFRKEHVKEMQAPLLELHQSFLQAGYVQIAGISLIYYAYVFYTGKNLAQQEKELALQSTIFTKMKFLPGIIHHQIYRQQVQNLMGNSENPSRLAGELFNMENMLPLLIQAHVIVMICIAYLHETIASYMFGDYQHAFESTQNAGKYIETDATSKESIIYSMHIFYDSLARLAIYPDLPHKEQKKQLKKVMQNQEKLQIWAHHAPMNYLHKFYLVEAELSRVKGTDEALDFYDKAIQEALENEYIQEAALACECTALFWLGKGKKNIAKIYLDDAIRYYTIWGATGKVKNLKEKHPGLIQDIVRTPYKTGIHDTIGISGTTGTQNLDLATVIKTSQALSSEIDLGKLLSTIMKLSIENAGAQHGYLILEKYEDKKLYIEAAGRIDKSVDVPNSILLDNSDLLSTSIVNYVHKTGENIVLGNASGDQRFINDPYIMRTHCKSILCTPIMNKGILSGILYMENNLSTDAFTPERLEILRVISAQAAISIENARLFELATTDGMTKLYVHRYFQLLLDQEMQRSHRYNRHFSLIMMDIDNFKAFNDTYGHQLGDEVLKSVARAVKNILRVNDVTARYGGEEFVVILPETDAPQAMIAAEKIRAVVEGLEIMHGEERLHVTISLGVAAYPMHAEEKEELIRLADMALYTSKHKGKNCVSLFEKKEMP